MGLFLILSDSDIDPSQFHPSAPVSNNNANNRNNNTSTKDRNMTSNNYHQQQHQHKHNSKPPQITMPPPATTQQTITALQQQQPLILQIFFLFSLKRMYEMNSDVVWNISNRSSLCVCMQPPPRRPLNFADAHESDEQKQFRRLFSQLAGDVSPSLF